MTAYFIREQMTPMSIHRLGASLLLQSDMLSTGLIRWPKGCEDINITPLCWPLVSGPQLLWRKKFMLLLFSKPCETYHPSGMDKVYFSEVMSKAAHCLAIGVLLFSDLIQQRPKL